MNFKKNDISNNLALIRTLLSFSFRSLRLPYAALLFSALLLIGLELLPSILLKRIIDQAIPATNMTLLWKSALLYLLAGLGSSLLLFFQTFQTTVIGQRILLELRDFLAQHLQRLPMTYFVSTSVGESMSRLTTDVEAIQSMFSAGLLHSMVDLLKVFGVVTAMFLISPGLTFVALLFTPLLFWISNYFRKHMYTAQQAIRKTVSEVNTFLQEIFQGIRMIKIYGKEQHYENRFQPLLHRYLQVNNHAAIYDSYFPCVLQVVRAFAVALVVFLGARTTLEDSLVLTIGSLAAFIDLSGRLFGPIEALSMQFQTIQQAMAGLTRVRELLLLEPEDRSLVAIEHVQPIVTDSASKPMISITKVDFGYRPQQKILHQIHWEIQSGQKVAIIGRTGAGKTTLLHLLAGVYQPEQGSIRIAGMDPFRMNPAERRRYIGIVPQTSSILEGTVLENITLRDDEITLEQVHKAIEMVGLQETVEKLPQGLQTVLGVGGIRLSYGENQLLALARAIVTDPPLLLLDEPTSGLDSLNEKKVFQAFRSIGRSRTIVTISHRLSGVMDADVVAMMAAGQLVQVGTPEELAGKDGWYSAFRRLETLGWQMTL